MVLFSATEGSAERHDAVMSRVKSIVQKAAQIKLSPAQLMEKMDHIKQFNYRVEQGKKVDFIKEVFETLEMTQTYIFINSIQYAKKIQEKLTAANLASHILHS